MPRPLRAPVTMGICATYPGITHRFIHNPKGLPCCPHRTILYPQFARPLYVGFLAKMDPSTNVPMKSMANAPFCRAAATRIQRQRTSRSFAPQATPEAARTLHLVAACGRKHQLTPGMKRSGIDTVPTAAEPFARRSITAFLQHPAACFVQAQALSIGMKARYHVEQRRNASPRKFH